MTKQYPTETYSSMGTCRCGCGKPTANRSGFYKDCRVATCRTCAKEFRWSGAPESTCIPCRAKRGNSDVKNAAEIGAIY